MARKAAKMASRAFNFTVKNPVAKVGQKGLPKQDKESATISPLDTARFASLEQAGNPLFVSLW